MEYETFGGISSCGIRALLGVIHFLLLLAVSAGLATFRGCPVEPVPDAAARALLVLAGMAMLPTLAHVGTAHIVGNLTAGHCPARRAFAQFRRLRAMHMGLWSASVAISFFVLRWPQLIRANWRLDGVFLGGDLTALAPAIVPWIASWMAFHRWEGGLAAVACRTAQAPASTVTQLPPVPSRFEYVMLHVRFYLSVTLLPAIVLLALLDAARWAAPDLCAHNGGVALSLASVAAVAAMFPWMLRCIWKSSPLNDGPLAESLRRLSCEAGVDARELRRWHTGGLVTNAAITGLFPRSRTVWLSDGLLDGMTADGIGAVFAHELGHLQRGHLTVRIAVLLAPLAALGALRGVVLQSTPHGLEPLFGGVGPSYLIAVALTIAGFAVYMGLVFGWVCRWMELDADLFAAQVLERISPNAGWSAVIDALEQLARAAGPSSRQRAGWMHPSVARRVEFLKRCRGDSDYLVHFQRFVGRLYRLWVWGTAALGLACLLFVA